MEKAVRRAAGQVFESGGTGPVEEETDRRPFENSPFQLVGPTRRNHATYSPLPCRAPCRALHIGLKTPIHDDVVDYILIKYNFF